MEKYDINQVSLVPKYALYHLTGLTFFFNIYVLLFFFQKVMDYHLHLFKQIINGRNCFTLYFDCESLALFSGCNLLMI